MAKVIDPLVYDFMIKASKNMFNAAVSGDPELAEATMVNLRATLDSYIHAIHEGNWNGN